MILWCAIDTKWFFYDIKKYLFITVFTMIVLKSEVCYRYTNIMAFFKRRFWIITK